MVEIFEVEQEQETLKELQKQKAELEKRQRIAETFKSLKKQEKEELKEIKKLTPSKRRAFFQGLALGAKLTGKGLKVFGKTTIKGAKLTAREAKSLEKSSEGQAVKQYFLGKPKEVK